MLVLSLIANILITFAVTVAIWRASPNIDQVFGPDGPARRILACVYLSIGLVSLFALGSLMVGHFGTGQLVAMTLLPLQIIYKLMTAVAVGINHPVVLTNLAVVILHSVTLITLL